MEVPRVAELGADCLQQLLAQATELPGGYFGHRLQEYRAEPRLARNLAQLVEIASWGDLQSSVLPMLETAPDFLIAANARDLSMLPTTASRLKSLFFLLEFNRDVGSDSIPNLARSLTAVLSAISIRGDSFDALQWLCAADLVQSVSKMATRRDCTVAPVLMQHAPNWNRELVDVRERVVQRLQTMLSSPDITKSPKLYSYLLFEALLHGLFDGATGERGVEGSELLRAHVEALKALTEKFDVDQRARGAYQPRIFAQVIYPKVFLAWLSRKGPFEFEDQEFDDWLCIVAPQLAVESTEAFRLGLIVKYCIAKCKQDVRLCFERRAVSAFVQEVNQERRNRVDLERRELGEMLRQSVDIRVEEARPLSGGWSSASLWRVKGGYGFLRPTGGDTELGRHRDDAPHEFSVVIKTGPKDSFVRAATLLRQLPFDAQKLFPMLGLRPSAFATTDQVKYFLVMEHLDGYVTIGERVKALLPENDTMGYPREEVFELVSRGIDAISSLHRFKAQGFPVSHGRGLASTARTELGADMARLIERFPEAEVMERKRIRVRDAEAGREWTLPSAGQVFRGSARRLRALSPRVEKRIDLALVHGDCHAHNIMVHPSSRDFAFVDVDNLHKGMPLTDYADYLAHLCFALNREDVRERSVECHLRERKGECEVEVRARTAECDDLMSDVLDTSVRRLAEELEGVYSGVGKAAIGELLLHLTGRRLVYVASKVATQDLALPTLAQGIGLLAAALSALGAGRGPAAVPLTSIDLNAKPWNWCRRGNLKARVPDGDYDQGKIR
ncbi:MAG: phosphotransferase [Candidatus Eisenbacteria bacterium]